MTVDERIPEPHALALLGLGLLSVLGRLEEALGPCDDPARPLERDHPLVLAALGALSVGETVRRRLAEVDDGRAPASERPGRLRRRLGEIRR